MQRNLRRKLCTELGFPRVWDLRYRFIFFMWLLDRRWRGAVCVDLNLAEAVAVVVHCCCGRVFKFFFVF